MIAGALRTVVQVQKPVVTIDDVGQRVPGWETVVTRRGALYQKSGNEQAGHAVLNVNAWDLRLRYDKKLADMNIAWRVVSGDRTFNIESIINHQQRHRELVLKLLEVV